MLKRREEEQPWLRPAGADDLGLRRALAAPLLGALVGAMAFLAALSVAGFLASAEVAAHWQQGAGASLTVQVPHPGAMAGLHTRREAVLAALQATPGLASVRALSEAELADLLRPWLGPDAERLSLPLPAVVAVRLAAPGGVDLAALNAKLQSVAPGTLVEREDIWAMRLAKLARSLELTAGAVLVVVALVAAAVVAVATRAGLSARREAIETVHGLGATDGYIAARFSARITRLAAAGGLLGALLAMPVLMGLSWLAMPFLRGSMEAASATPEEPHWTALLPPELWLLLVVLPVVTAGIGWLTAQATVRQWLRRLP
ncbi:MAG: hypothetical protein K6U10_05420 [Acidobacteriia bacterium]|nr:hypothetical protein [Methyloceanibacter sp.]MBX5471854.1 hypothetical protein [Acetobacteraceae bacterium]MCL6491245.1 hypothetical protein [Terriglobia bacterium]